VQEERKETYSPFLPISPKTGHVLQVPTLERNVAKGTIVYREPDGELVEVPVTGGAVKLQWKPDWAMRWAALGVDYEMFGKDLIPSAELGAKICRALGERPPEPFQYELFLDEEGKKISKSKGNGISMEDWLRYASDDSLSLYRIQKPRTAKRLYFDVIPKAVDVYHQHLRAYPEQTLEQQLANPVWHIGDQDAARLGHRVDTGELAVSVVSSVAGPRVPRPRLLRPRLGGSTAELLAGERVDAGVAEPPRDYRKIPGVLVNFGGTAGSPRPAQAPRSCRTGRSAA